MIKTKEGETKLLGTIPELSADFSVITSALKKTLTERIGEKLAKEELIDSFARGLMGNIEMKNIEIEEMNIPWNGKEGLN